MSTTTNTTAPTAAAGTATPAADDNLLAKCGSCQAEQPAKHKCCAECGEPMAKAAQAEYEAALAELGAFHKAQAALPDTPEVQPGEHGEADKVLAKARSGGDADGTELALAELLIGGQTINSDHLVALLGETRAARKDLGVGVGLMVKAFHAGLRASDERNTAAINALREEFSTFLNQPGRARSVQAATFHKALVQPEGGDGQDDSPRGDVLVKAAVDLARAGRIDPLEATLTQQYANAGHSLNTLAQIDPRLHARLSACLASATTH